MRDRPAIRRALELLRAGAIQGVVVPRIDRVGRVAAVTLDILHTIREAGGVVIYADMDLPKGPAGRFVEGVLASAAELDREVIRERTMGGRREKAESGRYPGYLLMFGYRLITKARAQVLPEYAGRDGELEIDPVTGPLVRELFERAAAGEGRSALGRWLAEQVGTGARGGRINGDTVRRYLRNPAYRGEIIYGAVEWRQISERRDAEGRLLPYDGRRRYQLSPRESGGQSIPCPAIVSAELWQRVNDRLDEGREAVRGRPTLTYLLRGCLRCSDCRRDNGQLAVLIGTRQNRNSTKRAYQTTLYRCPLCSRAVRVEKADRLALTALRRALQPATLQAQLERRQREQRGEGKDLAALVVRAQEELREALVAEEKAAALREDGFSEEIWRPRFQKAKERQQKARLRLAQLEAQAADQLGGAQAAAQAEAEGEALLARLAAAEREGDRLELQQLLRAHVQGWLSPRGRLRFEVLR